MPARALPDPRGEQAVYARSTTFQGRPGSIDAGIAFVKNEAVPMLDTLDGCRGLSLLVDRATGQCIATSSWESEETMRAVQTPKARAVIAQQNGVPVGSTPAEFADFIIAERKRYEAIVREAGMTVE